jgi:hypothetical protein
MAQASQMRLETVEPPHLFDYPARGKVATSDIALLFRGYVGGLYHRNDMALVGGAVSGCPVLLNHRTTLTFGPLLIGNRRYWRLSELTAWEETMATALGL